MKVLKDENEYTYDNFRELKSGFMQKDTLGNKAADNQPFKNTLPAMRNYLYF